MGPEALAQHEKDIIEKTKTMSLQELNTELNSVKRANKKVKGDPTYCSLKAQAKMHYHLRQECFHKAQSSYRNKMGCVAAFYSEQGRKHSEKLKETNKKAVEQMAT